jgi:hypothetical protein
MMNYRRILSQPMLKQHLMRPKRDLCKASVRIVSHWSQGLNPESHKYKTWLLITTFMFSFTLVLSIGNYFRNPYARVYF